MWKKFVKDYCSFTKKERIAVLVLVFLIIIFFILPFFIPENPVVLTPYDMKLLEQKPVQAKSFTGEATQGHYLRKTYNAYAYDKAVLTLSPAAGELFFFDPNTLPVQGWKKLGIRDRTISTIRNYVSKGGQFRNAGDLGKIYGLHQDEVKRLQPYVRIAATVEGKAEYRHPHAYHEKPLALVGIKAAAHELMDINTADTSAWISLPGIGSKLALRIVRFREKLGGFYSVEQVSETFGLPEDTFQQIRSGLTVSASGIQQLDLNHADVNQLKDHPYLRWNIANAIVAYRRQHGNFTGKEGLMQIDIITPEQYHKIAPYLMIR